MFILFFFNDTATTEIYTLSLHDALPISQSELGDLRPVEKEDPAAPADEFKFDGAPGTFGVITPVSEPFCARCSRLRLTADGKDRKSTRLNSSHANISYAVFCLKKKNTLD